MKMKRLVGFIFALAVIGCSREPFNGLSYTSYQAGNQYQFSGMPIRWEVQNETETPRGVEFVLVGRDSLGNELMKQYYLRQSDRLLWRGVDGAALGMTRFRFDPGLWACPFSDQIGQTFSYTNVEFRDEPLGLRLRIKVDSVIEAVEDVQTKVGRFEKCIKVKATVVYLDSTRSPFFGGDAAWWFARDIGVVKSKMPEGESELVFAQIGERFWP